MPKNVTALTDRRYTSWKKTGNCSQRWEEMFRLDRELRSLIVQILNRSQLPFGIEDRSLKNMAVSLTYARKLFHSLAKLKKV